MTLTFVSTVICKGNQIQTKSSSNEDFKSPRTHIEHTQIHLIKQHKSDLLDTLAVAFVGVDTDAPDSPEEDHAAAEEDNLVDIGLVDLPFDQEGALKFK